MEDVGILENLNKKPRNLTWLVEVWGIHDSYHHVDRLDDSISINIRYLTNQKYTAHGKGCFFLTHFSLHLVVWNSHSVQDLTISTRIFQVETTYLFAAPGCRPLRKQVVDAAKLLRCFGDKKNERLEKGKQISRVIFHSVLGTFDENPILVVFWVLLESCDSSTVFIGTLEVFSLFRSMMWSCFKRSNVVSKGGFTCLSSNGSPRNGW